MTVSQHGPTNDELRPDVAPDLRRDSESVLQVSRVAAELFWRDGVGATRGEDIAAVAGISVRTLWRYFRSKEACVEPILTSLARPLLELVAAWPLDRTLREHLAGRRRSGRVVYSEDQERGMRMVVLGRSEPALRVSWLMTCDHFERSLVPVFASRLQLPDDHVDVARITAAVAGANRAFNDSLASEYTRTGVSPCAQSVVETLEHCITEASGNRLGLAVTPRSVAGKDAR